MSLELGGITSQLIGLALDAAMVRHEVIANNIANHESPGYQVRRLNFESYLSDVSMQLRNGNESGLEGRIDALQSSLRDGQTMVVSEDHAVELDREMVRLTENTLRYQAILKAAAKRGQLVRMAINGGRQ